MSKKVDVLKKPRNPEFVELLQKMAEVHESKSHDYAQEDNVFSNFEYAGMVAAIFTDPTDRAFATLIGVKLARIAELKKGKTPKNESLLDTHLDASNYQTIWASRDMKNIKGGKK